MVSLKVLWDLIFAIFTIFSTIREKLIRNIISRGNFTVVGKRWKIDKNLQEESVTFDFANSHLNGKCYEGLIIAFV